MTNITELNVNFEEACDIYTQSLVQRTSNRSNKELRKGNTKGTAIHKFQISFAWIMRDIENSPPQLLEYNIIKAHAVINHILEAASSTVPNE